MDHTDCSPSREYITTVEFLRAQKSFELGEEATQKMADQVAQNCQPTGSGKQAASRLIRVTEVLLKAQYGGKDALQWGLKLSRKSDSFVDAWITVLKETYAEDGLDLDLRQTQEVLNQLFPDKLPEFATEKPEDYLKALQKDYRTIVRYCLSNRKLDVPKARCAKIALTVAQPGRGLAEAWIKLFEFLTESKGPELTTATALDLATEITLHGSAAVDSWMQAYRFALAEKGLKNTREQAVSFASKLARYNRLPGS